MFWDRYSPYLPVLISAAVFGVFAVFYYLASRRSVASNRGGLAWIRRYGKAGFRFDLQALTSYHKDWLCVFGAEVFSLVVSLVYTLVASRHYTGAWFDLLFTSQTLLRILVALGGTAAAYLLLQDLFDDNLLSTFGALLFTAARMQNHSAHCLIMVAAWLMLRWLLTDEDAPLFPRELLYGGAALALCVACATNNRLIWLAVLLLGLHAFLTVRKALLYGSAGTAAAGLAFGLGVWLVSLLVIAVGRYVLIYRPLSVVLTGERFLRMFAFPFYGFTAAVAGIFRGRLLNPIVDAPLFCLGVLGLLRSLRSVRERHDPRGLFILCLLGALGLIWLVFDAYALLPGLILSLGFVWDSFTQSRKKAPVVFCGLLFLLYYLCLHIAGFLIPLTESILIQIF